MQTFLPYASFVESAKVLDYKRLGKQRVETWQILRALQGTTKGWRNHPATLMWADHEFALCFYGYTMCMEWKSRGYKDTMAERFLNARFINATAQKYMVLPEWFGNLQFHRSHQSNLVRKAPEYYKDKFPGVPNDLDYVWPS